MIRKNTYSGLARFSLQPISPLQKILIMGLICLFSAASSGYAQNMIITADEAKPDSSAMLHIKSTTQGLLIPRMTETQKLAISNAAQGLLVYQTDGSKGLWMMDSVAGAWNLLLDSASASLTLADVLANGNDANQDSIFNLSVLTIGADQNMGDLAIYDSAGSALLNMGVSGTGSTQSATINLFTQTDFPFEFNANNKAWTITARGNAFSTANAINNLVFGHWNGTAWVNSMQLDTNGFVGIGANNPSERLDVNGNMRADEVHTDGVYHEGFASNNYLQFVGNNQTEVYADDFMEIGAGKFVNLRVPEATVAVSVTDSGVAFGTTNPATPLMILGNGATNPVGITQNAVGGGATMELTTTDGADNQATRILLRGGADATNIEFYTGAAGSEVRRLHMDGTTGQFAIGHTDPAHLLDLDGNARMDSLYLYDSTNAPNTGDVITAFGTDGRAYWSDPSSLGIDLEDALTADSNANGISARNLGGLSIGQTGLSGLITVNGNDLNDITLKTTDNTLSQGLAFQNSGGAYTWNIFRADAGSNDADLVFSGGDANATITALDERLRILSTGEVGIGESAPLAKLHVTATDNTGDIRLEDTFPFIFLNSTTTNNAGIIYQQNGTQEFEAYYATASNRYIINHMSSTGDDININASGNIGMGTNSQVDKLHLLSSSNVRLRTESTSNGYSGLVAENTAGEYFVGVQGSADPVPGEFHIYQNSGSAGQRMVIDATGRVGIATSDPQTMLHIDGGTDAGLATGGYLQLNASSGTNMVFDNNEIMVRNNGTTAPLYIQNDGGSVRVHDAANDSTRFRITNDGRVSIGTSTVPNYPVKLNVAGRIQFGSVEYIEDGGGNIINVRGGVVPTIDNSFDLGTPTLRWDDVYATNGTINTSDARDKENISDLNYGIDEIMQLSPISFTWKEQGYEGKKLGLTAQDLQEVIPEVVKAEDWQKNEDGQLEKVTLDRLGVYYSDLIPVLIKAIQEQQAQIESLEAEIESLK